MISLSSSTSSQNSGTCELLPKRRFHHLCALTRAKPSCSKHKYSLNIRNPHVYVTLTIGGLPGFSCFVYDTYSTGKIPISGTPSSFFSAFDVFTIKSVVSETDLSFS